MRTELKKLFKEMGATVIYVTHDQQEAMSMSDTIVVMKDGLLQQQGTAKEIYSAPANIFVAGFLGSPRINLIAGECKGDRFLSTGFELPLSLTDFQNRGTDRQNGRANLFLGVRPEHIEILAEPRSDAIAGHIELLEPLGLYIKVIVRVGKEMIAALSMNDLFSQGQDVWIRFDTKELLFFDAETERLIKKGEL